MLFQKLLTWFLPAGVRGDKLYPGYSRLFTVTSANIVGMLRMGLIPLALLYFKPGTQL